MRKRILAALLMMIIASSQLVSVAQADDSYDESFYSSNDILFFDPRCDTGVAEGLISLTGKDNLEKILKFFMYGEPKLSLAQSAGIIGNLMAESQLDPSIIQGGGKADKNYIPVNGKGFGLAQWTFTARQQPLVDFMKSYGDITNLDGQVGFIWHELTTTEGDALRALKAADNPLDAAYVFHKYYEGSADSELQVKLVRGGNAQKVYDQYADSPPLENGQTSTTGTDGKPTINSTSTVAKSTGRSCLATAAGGDLVQLVQSYAWPEYKGLTVTPTDTYRDAVQTALGQGRYVGGTSYPGIDCGGFVTTLIIDSKYDENYNYGSMIAKGAGNTIKQEQWLKQNWKKISDTDPTDRQPGDVAINDTHTYIFVGPDAFPNKKPIASASWDERAPMQGNESVVSTAHSYFRWYRKPVTATSNPTSGSSVAEVAGGNGGGGSN